MARMIRSEYVTKSDEERLRKQKEAYSDDGSVAAAALSLGTKAYPWYAKVQNRLLKNSQVFNNQKFATIIPGEQEGTSKVLQYFKPKSGLNLGRWSKGVELNPDYVAHMKKESPIDFYKGIAKDLKDNGIKDKDIANILGDKDVFRTGDFSLASESSPEAVDELNKPLIEKLQSQSPGNLTTSADQYRILQEKEILTLGAGDFEKGKRIFEKKYGISGEQKVFDNIVNDKFSKVSKDLGLGEGADKKLYSTTHVPSGAETPWTRNYTRDPQVIDNNDPFQTGVTDTYDPDKVINIAGITPEQSDLIQAAELSKAKKSYEKMKRDQGFRTFKFDRDATVLDKKVALGGEIGVVSTDLSGPNLGKIDYNLASTSTGKTNLIYDPATGGFKAKARKLPGSLADPLPDYESPSGKILSAPTTGGDVAGGGFLKQKWNESMPGKVTKAALNVGRGGVKEAWAGSKGKQVVTAFKNIGKGGMKSLFGGTAATGTAATGAASTAATAGNTGLFASMGPAGWTVMALGLLGDKLFKKNTVLGKIFSDKRLKKNIKKIGKSPSGINIYQFNYKDTEGTYNGVISQDVPKEAVERDFSGYDMVDYNKIDVDFVRVN